MAGLKIGGLAKLSGTTVKAIRFYEAQGLLPRPVRSQSGYRLYTDRDLKRLAFIQRAKLLGLPLEKIQDLVIHLTEEECACSTIRPHLERSIREQLKDVVTRLDQLALLKEDLEAFLGKLSRATRALPNELCTCTESGSHQTARRLFPVNPKEGGRRR
jgi:MerR family mercuric resistance operon transcriptional regulator